MLVLSILLPMFIVILQAGFAVYVRNTLAACAQNAARWAASADIVGQGEAAIKASATQRAQSCVSEWIPANYTTKVEVDPANGIDAQGDEIDRVTLGGNTVVLSVVKVEITGATPLIGPFDFGMRSLRVTGEALRETP